MKHMRSAAKASAAAKMKAMGGSCGGRSHKYASGGVVRSVKAYASGGSVLDEIDGEMPMARMDRPSRGGKSKGGSKTNVNVIVMPKGSDAPAMPPVVPPPAAAAPPMPLPPPKPPMMPPQGPPDMPMHKHGGRVAAFKRGGKVKKADGGIVDKIADAASYVSPALPIMAGVRAAQAYARNRAGTDAAKSAGSGTTAGVIGNDVGKKRGGKVHSDAADDRKMIKGMVKEGALKKKADGGPVSEYLRGKEKNNRETAKVTGTATGLGALGALHPGRMGAAARTINAGIAGLGGLLTATGMGQVKRYKDAAEKFENNDLPGRPDYEAEGKKRGGKVKRASGGRVHMTAGAGSGEGRIEKTAHAKKVKRA